MVYSATSNKYKKQSTGQTRDNNRNQSIHCGSNGRKFCISNGTNLTRVKVAWKETSAGTLAMNDMLVFQKTCQLLSLIKTDDSAPAKWEKYWIHTLKKIAPKGFNVEGGVWSSAVMTNEKRFMSC